jgi:CheY-like chemotaxis protein
MNIACAAGDGEHEMQRPTNDRRVEILLVEDCRTDEELTLIELQRHGLANAIGVVRDGCEALELLERAARGEAAVPDLILLDLRLPKVSGVEVFRRLQSDPATRAIPIAVLSSEDEKDAAEAARAGAVHFLPKPVTFARLAEIARQLGWRWALLTRPASAPSAS